MLSIVKCDAMKININAIQHINAAIILGTCIFYPLFYVGTYYIEFGVFIWAASLPFLYLPDLMEIPDVSKEEMEDTKKISIPVSWFFVLFFWGFLIENNLLWIITLIFFIILVAYCLYYIKIHWKKEKGAEEKKSPNEIQKIGKK